MEIEMIYDPIEVAIGTGLEMGPQHQVCPDGEWVKAVKRITGRDDLFVYYHAWTGNFVLAQWVYTEEDNGFRVCVNLKPWTKLLTEEDGCPWTTSRCDVPRNLQQTTQGP